MDQDKLDYISESLVDVWNNFYCIALRNHYDIAYIVSDIEDLIGSDGYFHGDPYLKSEMGIVFLKALITEFHTSFEEAFYLSEDDRKEITYQLLEQLHNPQIVNYKRDYDWDIDEFDIYYSTLTIDGLNQLSRLQEEENPDFSDYFAKYRLHFVKSLGDSEYYTLKVIPLFEDGEEFQSEFFPDEGTILEEYDGQLKRFMEFYLEDLQEDSEEESEEDDEQEQYDSIKAALDVINP